MALMTAERSESTEVPEVPGSPEATELRSAMDALSRFVSGFEPARYSGRDAAVLVRWFTRCERLAHTGKALAAARAAEGRSPASDGHPTPAHWLSQLTGESIGESVGVLRMGETITDHAAMDEACREGRLSRQPASMVGDALSVNPDSGDGLVAAAETDTLRQLRDRCLKAKAEARSRQDAATLRRALHDSRHCRTFTDRDGAFRLDARLTPEAGATLAAALAAESDRLGARARRAGHHDAPDATRADALVALVSGRGLAGVTGTDPDGGDGEPRAQVLLRVDLDRLRRGSIGPGGTCEIPGVGPVSLDTAEELMGDAITRLVITNGVDVTTVCHLGRTIPAPLRTALLERDRCCVVPGCDITTGLEIDHWPTPYAEGGPASLANLIRICSHHHRLRHHHGFTLTGGPGHWRWDPPSTEPKPGTEHPPDTGDPPRFSLEE
jgi:hypothetical protein